jgi:hypothetical protein
MARQEAICIHAHATQRAAAPRSQPPPLSSSPYPGLFRGAAGARHLTIILFVALKHESGIAQGMAALPFAKESRRVWRLLLSLQRGSYDSCRSNNGKDTEPCGTGVQTGGDHCKQSSCCLAHVAVLMLPCSTVEPHSHVVFAGRFLSCLPAWLAQAPSFLVLQFFLAQLATRALRMPAQASACAAPSLWAVLLPWPLSRRERGVGERHQLARLAPSSLAPSRDLASPVINWQRRV